jgi:hypothetical protein
MKWNYLLVAAALTAAITTPVLAAPLIQLVDNLDSTVTLQIVTTATGSLGVETAVTLEMPPTLNLVGATVNTSIFDTPDPGDNPFIAGSPVGGDSSGLWLDLLNDRLFASYGSVVVMAGAYDFLTIAYSGYGSINASGVVGLQGVLTDVSSNITVGVPEPTTAALVGLAAIATITRRRAG